MLKICGKRFPSLVSWSENHFPSRLVSILVVAFQIWKLFLFFIYIHYCYSPDSIDCFHFCAVVLQCFLTVLFWDMKLLLLKQDTPILSYIYWCRESDSRLLLVTQKLYSSCICTIPESIWNSPHYERFLITLVGSCFILFWFIRTVWSQIVHCPFSSFPYRSLVLIMKS